MGDVYEFTGVEHLDDWPVLINGIVTEILTSLANTTTGHDHDGANSKQVDHTDLTSIGTNTHADLDQLVIDFGSHIEDEELHGEGSHQLLADRDDVSSGVDPEDHAHIAAAIWWTTGAKTVEEALNTAAPEAHDGLTGLDTEATGADPEDHRHLAQAIWDGTAGQNVQDTLDTLGDYLLTEDLADEINALADHAINGDIIAVATDTTEGVMLLGAAGGAAAFEHTHAADTDETVTTENTITIAGVSTACFQRALNNANRRGVQLINEMINGNFVYATSDGNASTGFERVLMAQSADTPIYIDPDNTADYPYGIPGWYGVLDSVAGKIRCNLISISGLSGEPIGTAGPLISTHGFQAITINLERVSGTFTGYIASDAFYLLNGQTYTFNLWYKKNGSSNPTLTLKMQHYTLGAWADVWTKNIGSDADTSWHQAYGTFTAGSGEKHRLIIYGSSGVTWNPIYTIARVSVFEGDWSQALESLPASCWNSRLFNAPNEIAYGAEDTAPTPGVFRTNMQEFSTEYSCEFDVTSTYAATTIPIPSTNYIYDIKVSATYDVSGWTWDITTAYNWSDPIAAAPITVPAPGSSGRVKITVKYWPRIL